MVWFLLKSSAACRIFLFLTVSSARHLFSAKTQNLLLTKVNQSSLTTSPRHLANSFSTLSSPLKYHFICDILHDQISLLQDIIYLIPFLQGTITFCIVIWDYLLMLVHPLNSKLSEGIMVFALTQHFILYIQNNACYLEDINYVC